MQLTSKGPRHPELHSANRDGVLQLNKKVIKKLPQTKDMTRIIRPQDSQSVMKQYVWQGAYLFAHQPCQELSKSSQT